MKKQIDGITFDYNEDFTGDIAISGGGKTVTVPAEILRQFTEQVLQLEELTYATTPKAHGRLQQPPHTV